MGIKTYNVIETAGLLKGKGINVVLDGMTTLYIPSKALLHKENGVYKLNVEENGRVNLAMSTPDEDKICREVLKMNGIKTIKKTVKKVESVNNEA